MMRHTHKSLHKVVYETHQQIPTHGEWWDTQTHKSLTMDRQKGVATYLSMLMVVSVRTEQITDTFCM